MNHSVRSSLNGKFIENIYKLYMNGLTIFNIIFKVQLHVNASIKFNPIKGINLDY